jgi:NitT/TauT family transport system permease protein
MYSVIRNRALEGIAPITFFVLLALGWQWVAVNFESVVPPLEQVANELIDKPEFYLHNLWVTLYAALLGFLYGGITAIFFAAIVVHFKFLRSAIWPVALLLNVTPIVAISPALIVAFGFTALPHIIVASIAAFFPMFINTMTGLRAVDPQAHEVFRSMSATRLDTFIFLRLPGSLSHIFSGARLSITAAMIGSVVSEFMGTSEGIGATIVLATAYLNLPQMWAAIFTSAIISLMLVGLVSLIEKWTIRW